MRSIQVTVGTSEVWDDFCETHSEMWDVWNFRWVFYPHRAKSFKVFFFYSAVYLCSYIVRPLSVRGHSNTRGTNRKRAKACREIEKMLRKKIRGYKCMKWTEGMVGGGEKGAEVEHGVKGLVTQKSHSHQQLDRKSSCRSAAEQEVTKAVVLTFRSLKHQDWRSTTSSACWGIFQPSSHWHRQWKIVFFVFHFFLKMVWCGSLYEGVKNFAITFFFKLLLRLWNIILFWTMDC